MSKYFFILQLLNDILLYLCRPSPPKIFCKLIVEAFNFTVKELHFRYYSVSLVNFLRAAIINSYFYLYKKEGPQRVSSSFCKKVVTNSRIH